MDTSNQVSINKRPWWKNWQVWILLLVLLVLVAEIANVLGVFKKNDVIAPVPLAPSGPKVLTEQERADIVKQLSATTTLKTSEREKIINQLSN